MEISNELKLEIRKLFEQAYTISHEIGEEIELAFNEIIEKPLTREEFKTMISIILTRLKNNAMKRGDKEIATKISKDFSELIDSILFARDEVMGLGTNLHSINLVSLNGINPKNVEPSPTFHRRKISMRSGYVKTTDIELWEKNERLDIHVSHFISENGRTPNSNELLNIMLSEMPMQGLKKEDEFNIIDLARSIANNGVRQPPIIDIDGTLLDGNRRIAACYYILSNDEFDSDQKKRAEYVYVWQLTEFANDDDRNAVVVSLNFEPDYKQNWPEYVKAKKIFEEWEAMVAREPNTPGPARIRELRKELARNFGYGDDPHFINRYIKMVDISNEFETYLTSELHKDEFSVKHQANRYFQYFEEIGKGTNPGGVWHTLNQNEPFKHLVFDLLFQDKFKNWTIIRLLKYYNQDVHDALLKAKDISDIEEAQDFIEDKLSEAKSQQRESRVGNANQRIEVFYKWLEALPISSFRDSISKENLYRLLEALRLVEKQITQIEKAS